MQNDSVGLAPQIRQLRRQNSTSRRRTLDAIARMKMHRPDAPFGRIARDQRHVRVTREAAIRHHQLVTRE
jgi:hypothetical protein